MQENMSYIIISDTHFGDPLSSLVEKNQDGKYIPGSGFKKFKTVIENKIGQNNSVDYIILLGDIFDIAIKDYAESYKIAKVFFNEVTKLKIVKKGFIYVPGNHDFEMWHLAQYEVNIINKLKNNKDVEKFKHSVPGIIDARKETQNERFFLHDVTPLNENNSNNAPRYGGLYLDNLIDENKKLSDDEKFTFSIAYPNLYIATDKGTILLTHGHYLNLAWSAISKYAPILEDEITVDNIVDYVSLNFPINQLSSSGFGQAGKLTDIILKIMQECKNDDCSRITKKYVRNSRKINRTLGKLIKLMVKGYEDLQEMKDFWKKVKEFFHKSSDRGNKKFPKKNEYLKDYFSKIIGELKEINDYIVENHKPNSSYTMIKDVNKIIFGHTHKSVSLENGYKKKVTSNKEASIYNTGSWLKKKKHNKLDAEIFFIINGELTSEHVE